MVVAVHVVRVDASLLDGELHSLLHLVFLSLVDDGSELLSLILVRDLALVECDRRHGSHLHSHTLSHLVVAFLVECHESAEEVLVHVVVSHHFLALHGHIAVEFHLLTSDARAIHHSLFSRNAVDVEFLHLVEGLALGSHSCVDDFVGELHELSVLSHEVGLALEGHHSTEVAVNLSEHTSLSSLTVATLCSHHLTFLAKDLHSSLHVAVSLCERFLAVHQSGLSLLTECIYFF